MSVTGSSDVQSGDTLLNLSGSESEYFQAVYASIDSDVNGFVSQRVFKDLFKSSLLPTVILNEVCLHSSIAASHGNLPQRPSLVSGFFPVPLP